MLRTHALVRILAGAVLVSGAWGQDVVRAGEEKKVAPAKAAAQPKPKKDDAAEAKAKELKEALKGFKGFLVGRVVGKNDTGVTLEVTAVTLVEGCTAKNPGILLGKATPVKFATEKDDEGKERPVKWLADAVARIEQMQAFAFGGLGGNNAVVVIDVGKGGNAKAFGGAVKMMTRTMTMRINGQKIKIGGGDDDEGKDDDAKGPLATARVLSDEEGNLVMDRVMPGGQPYAAWDAMPRVRFADAKKLKRLKKLKQRKKDTDF